MTDFLRVRTKSLTFLLYIWERSTTYQICTVCGYVADGGAPDNCPVCGADRSQFQDVD